MIQIIVPGQPQGKGRARFARQGKFVRAFTPEKTVAYEGLIALAGQKVMEGRNLMDGPVYLTVEAIFAFPKSGWSQKKRASRPIHWHVSKPDNDNIIKAVADGLNGIVWKDDSQVALAKGSKFYGDVPRLIITVEALP